MFEDPTTQSPKDENSKVEGLIISPNEAQAPEKAQDPSPQEKPADPNAPQVGVPGGPGATPLTEGGGTIEEEDHTKDKPDLTYEEVVRLKELQDKDPFLELQEIRHAMQYETLQTKQTNLIDLGGMVQ